MTSKEELLKVARDEFNNYEQTVNAILSFVAFITHDSEKQRCPNSEFGIGRRMTTSKNNLISPAKNINPDIVIQKSKEFGIVVEVKKSLNKNYLEWDKPIKQLRKYDDKLLGWWTAGEEIAAANTIMLIHQSRGRAFVRALEARKKATPDSVGPNTCVVEFNYSGEATAYYFFRLEFGTISDKEINPRLVDGVDIPLDDIRKCFPNIQFYDAKPPLCWLLFRLWTDLFPSLAEEGVLDEKSKSIKIQVSVLDVTEELQKAFGSKSLNQDLRSSEFPQQKWIREALERLITYKLAMPAPNGNGKYIIYYKPFRGDVLDRFMKYELKKYNVKKTSDNEKQLPMFPDEDK